MPAFAIASWLVIIAIGAIIGFTYFRGRPEISLGVLFVAASFSGITAPLFDVNVRLEQPAVLLLGAVLVLGARQMIIDFVLRARWAVLGLITYVVVTIASGLLNAPDPGQSLKIAGWLALSVSAGGIVATIVGSSPAGVVAGEGLRRWIIIAGVAHSFVAIAQVTAEVWLGSDWGVLRRDAPIGKAYGLAWEPNLLSIQLAATAMFLMDPRALAQIPRFARWPAAVVLGIGLALALSRGGLVALLVGSSILGLSVGYRAIRDRAYSPVGEFVPRATILAAVAVGGYFAVSWLGAQGVGLRPGDVVTEPGPQAPLVAVSPGPSKSPAGPSPQAQPTSSLPPPSAVPASPEPNYVGTGDTVALRFRNLVTAVEDGMTNPLIGRGIDTFGQRFLEPTCRCPAHIPTQLAATFYESGLLGLLGLTLGLGLILLRGWRAGYHDFAAAVVVLLVGYQFTDALRFASNWILVGAVAGLAFYSSRGTDHGRARSGKALVTATAQPALPERAR